MESKSSTDSSSSLTSSASLLRARVQDNRFEDGLQQTQTTLQSKAPLELAKFELIEGVRKDKQEVKKLLCKVVRDSENITKKFAQLALAVYRLLNRNKVDLEEVRTLVLFMGCCKTSLPGEQNIRMFNNSNDIAEVPNLHLLIQSLRKYSSWFNYRLMKIVAEEFGGEEGKKLISDYEDELRHYFEAVIVYQCPQFSLTEGIRVLQCPLP